MKKDRYPGPRRFSDEEELEIKQEFIDGNITKTALAAKYGIHRDTVSIIVKGRR